MNATTARLARHMSRRCWTSSAPFMANSNTTSVPTSFSPLQQSLSQLSATTIRATTPTPVRFFWTAPGGGGTADDENANASKSGNGDDDDDVLPPPPVIGLESHFNADAYDPYEITKSFEDTSYYFPPAEETDPKFLASKYEGMTNEELLDTSSIAAPVPNTSIDKDHTWDSLMHSPPIRDKAAALPKGTLVGTVVSTKMQKTVNVAVDRYKIHPKYRKRLRYTRKFMAHDENEVARDGDLVLIVPSQRISKNKHFVLQEILKAKGQL